MLRAPLLHEPQDAVEHDDGEDRDRIQPLAQRAGNKRGGDEYPDEQVCKLPTEPPPPRLARRLGQLVSAVADQSLGCLGGAEADAGVSHEGSEDRFGRNRVGRL